MLQFVVEAIAATGLQALGWGVLKVVTAGRYQGFQPEDLMVEGSVGFGAIAALAYGLYRWWPF